jgi:hypothetical protein
VKWTPKTGGEFSGEAATKYDIIEKQNRKRSPELIKNAGVVRNLEKEI